MKSAIEQRIIGIRAAAMLPAEIDCGICGKPDNSNNRQLVPFLNGDLTTSDVVCDGYNAVCPGCYDKWEAWDDRNLNKGE